MKQLACQNIMSYMHNMNPGQCVAISVTKTRSYQNLLSADSDCYLMGTENCSLCRQCLNKPASKSIKSVIQGVLKYYCNFSEYRKEIMTLANIKLTYGLIGNAGTLNLILYWADQSKLKYIFTS